MAEKLCRKCDEYWPLDEEFFFKSAKTKDGFDTGCKACYFDSPSVKARQVKNPNRRLRSAWEDCLDANHS